MAVKIVDIAISTGENIVTLQETVDNFTRINNIESQEQKENTENFLKAIGRDIRVISNEEESTVTLGVRAVDKLLEQNQTLNKEEIGLLIYMQQDFQNIQCLHKLH